MATIDVEVLHECRRPGGNLVRTILQRNDANGRESVNIREWYFNDDDELMPTRKGVVLSIEQFTAMVEATAALRENATPEPPKPSGKPVKSATARKAAAKKAAAAVTNEEENK